MKWQKISRAVSRDTMEKRVRSAVSATKPTILKCGPFIIIIIMRRIIMENGAGLRKQR